MCLSIPGRWKEISSKVVCRLVSEYLWSATKQDSSRNSCEFSTIMNLVRKFESALKFVVFVGSVVG